MYFLFMSFFSKTLCKENPWQGFLTIMLSFPYDNCVYKKVLIVKIIKSYSNKKNVLGCSFYFTTQGRLFYSWNFFVTESWWGFMSLSQIKIFYDTKERESLKKKHDKCANANRWNIFSQIFFLKRRPGNLLLIRYRSF